MMSDKVKQFSYLTHKGNTMNEPSNTEYVDYCSTLVRERNALEAENRRLRDALDKIEGIQIQCISAEDLIAVSFIKDIAHQTLNGDEK